MPINCPLTLRTIKGSKLTFNELDGNFLNLRNCIYQLENQISTQDTFVTGGTYNPATVELDFIGNSGFNPFSVDVSALKDDTNTFVTGVTYTQSASTLTLTRNDGVSLSTTIVSSGGGGMFTGNTSGTCINELWVSNISGCSPVTIGTELVVNDDATFDGNIAQTGTTSTFSNGNYLQIGTGFANAGQLTFNANHDGGLLTDTYTPTYAGDGSAGMTVVKMPNGGVGGLDFYVKNHGLTSGSQDLSTFTKILELNQDGNSTFGGNILLGDGSVSNNYIGLGDSQDLKIFHNGAHSIIREVGTGDLYLQSDQNVILSKDSSTEFMVRGIG